MKKITLLFIAIVFWVNGFAQITFQKVYGLGGWDVGLSSWQTTDGGYMVMGSSSNKIFLLKTNNAGVASWAKTYNGSGNESPWSTSTAEPTSDGGYIITGQTTSFGAGSTDLFLLKTDSAGNIIWSKAYGGPLHDRGTCVLQTSDGGYIAAGQTEPFLPGQFNAFVVKTDSNGDTLWTKRFGGTSATIYGWFICQTNDGGYLLCGECNYLGFDGYALRMDSAGNVLWAKDYNVGGYAANFRSVLQATDGGFVFSGQSGGIGLMDACVLKTDSSGTPVWSRVFGGSNNDVAYFARQTSNGSYIIAGGIQDVGFGTQDACLFMFSSVGSFIGSRIYGSGQWDFGTSVRPTNDGGYILTGGTDSLSSGTTYLIKTSSVLFTSCNSGFPTNSLINNTTVGTSVSTSSTSGCTVTAAPFTTTVPSIFQYTFCADVLTATDNISNSETILLSPNPATSEIKIENVKSKIECIEIFNTLGEIVYDNAGTSQTNTETINVSKLSSGIYFVRVKTSDGMMAGKFVKE